MNTELERALTEFEAAVEKAGLRSREDALQVIEAELCRFEAAHAGMADEEFWRRYGRIEARLNVVFFEYTERSESPRLTWPLYERMRKTKRDRSTEFTSAAHYLRDRKGTWTGD